MDIPDGLSSLKFYIKAHDSDLTGYETIDYVPGSGSYYVHTVFNPFSETYSYTGSGGSYNAQLDYEIYVVLL